MHGEVHCNGHKQTVYSGRRRHRQHGDSSDCWCCSWVRTRSGRMDGEFIVLVVVCRSFLCCEPRRSLKTFHMSKQCIGATSIAPGLLNTCNGRVPMTISNLRSYEPLNWETTKLRVVSYLWFMAKLIPFRWRALVFCYWRVMKP